MEEKEIPIKVSLEYGEGICPFINGSYTEDITTNCDNFNYFSEPENNPFDYFIKNIYYTLKENEFISSLKVV